MDRLREAPYTEDSLRRSGFNISRISSMNRLFGSRSSVKSGLVVIPECERGIPSTGFSVRRGVKSFVRNGGHLVVLGSNAKNGRRWLDRIYGWRTKTSVSSYSRGGWRRAWNASSDLPRSVSYCDHVEATQMAKMPPGAVSYYSSGGYSGLWSRDIGRGKVTFIAYDWYQGSTCSGGRFLDVPKRVYQRDTK